MPEKPTKYSKRHKLADLRCLITPKLDKFKENHDQAHPSHTTGPKIEKLDFRAKQHVI